jgi:hypothetical protein
MSDYPIISYVLFVYLCCQPNSIGERFECKSKQEAAIIFWEKNQDGLHCYTGKLLEYHFIPDNPDIKEIPIPKVKFTD